MKPHSGILDGATKVPLAEISPLIERFIRHSVIASKRDRWLELSQKPKKFRAKFSGLWNSLDMAKGKELNTLNLSNGQFLYYCMESHGYRLNSEDVNLAADGEDGFLFNQSSDKVILATHESYYIEFTIPNGG